MKMSRLSQNLVLIMPLIAVLASVGVVAQQNARRERLKSEYAAWQREHDTLEKKYKDLRKAAGLKPAEEPAAHDHHDDGD